MPSPPPAAPPAAAPADLARLTFDGGRWAAAFGADRAGNAGNAFASAFSRPLAGSGPTSSKSGSAGGRWSAAQRGQRSAVGFTSAPHEWQTPNSRATPRARSANVQNCPVVGPRSTLRRVTCPFFASSRSVSSFMPGADGLRLCSTNHGPSRSAVAARVVGVSRIVHFGQASAGSARLAPQNGQTWTPNSPAAAGPAGLAASFSTGGGSSLLDFGP